MTNPKRLATPEEKAQLRQYLLSHGCPLEYVDKIVGDRPYIETTQHGEEFCNG